MFRFSLPACLRACVSACSAVLSFALPASAQVQAINGAWDWPDQGITLNPEGDTDGGAYVYDLLPHDGKLVVGGGFWFAGGMPAEYLAVWDGHSWSGLGSGFPEGPVRSLLELNGALYIGGGFNSIGGLQIAACAKWDGEIWSKLGEGLSWTIDVADLEPWNDRTGSVLFAAAQTIFRWDGEDWSIPGGGVSGGGGGARALAVYDDGTGPALYATGSFKYAGGVLCNGIAKWDGTKWSPLGQGLNSPPGAYGSALAVYDDGNGEALYLGGYFYQIDGKPIRTLARWNGKTWSAVGDPNLHPEAAVEKLRVLDDGSEPALYLSDWTLVQKWNGQQWKRYPPIYGVGAMAIFPGPDGPTLHIGGGLNLGDNDNPRYTNIAYFQPGFACGDFNKDGVTDQKDLGILLAAFNCTGDCSGDADGDGDTDQEDLGILLAHFGQTCG